MFFTVESIEVGYCKVVFFAVGSIEVGYSKSSLSGGGVDGLVLLHYATDNSLKLKFKIFL